MTRSLHHMLPLAGVLALNLALAVPTLAQTTPNSAALRKAAPSESEQLYIKALGDTRKAGPLDAKAVAAARGWVDGLDAIVLVDQEILGSGRSIAELLYQKNKGQ